LGSGGGHLEIGESLKDGALRELKEEAGNNLKIKNVKFLGVVNFTEMKPKHYVDISFKAEWVSGEPVNQAPNETTDWQWFLVDDLPSPLFPPVEKYFQAIKTRNNFFDSKF
jgi:8-oxo-dGTP diphosphatase